MKLSTETISTLKNYASINSNIVFREGHTLKTISEAKNIMASTEISEFIPNDFGIYDLNEFLSVLNLFDDPDIEITKDRIYITAEGQRVQYFTAAESVLTSPNKNITMPPVDVAFKLSDDNISSLRRAASTFGVNDVIVRSDDGGISIDVTDHDNPTSNTYTIDLKQSTDQTFNAIFNINNFRLMSGNYNVEISSKLISKFTLENSAMMYYIALEKNSNFDT